jgi:hypothetical protein
MKMKSRSMSTVRGAINRRICLSLTVLCTVFTMGLMTEYAGAQFTCPPAAFLEQCSAGCAPAQMASGTIVRNCCGDDGAVECCQYDNTVYIFPCVTQTTPPQPCPFAPENVHECVNPTQSAPKLCGEDGL